MSKTYRVVLKKGIVAITPSDESFSVEFIGMGDADVTLQFAKNSKLLQAIHYELDDRYPGSYLDYGGGSDSKGFARLFIATHQYRGKHCPRY